MCWSRTNSKGKVLASSETGSHSVTFIPGTAFNALRNVSLPRTSINIDFIRMQLFLHDFSWDTVELATSRLETEASFKLIGQIYAQAWYLRRKNLPMLHPERVAHYLA